MKIKVIEIPEMEDITEFLESVISKAKESKTKDTLEDWFNDADKAIKEVIDELSKEKDLSGTIFKVNLDEYSFDAITLIYEDEEYTLDDGDYIQYEDWCKELIDDLIQLDVLEVVDSIEEDTGPESFRIQLANGIIPDAKYTKEEFLNTFDPTGILGLNFDDYKINE